jgi:anaerobic magnesium-protoporphyrin IX monomethyl ester cyclase
MMKVLLLNPFVDSKKIYGHLSAFSPILPPLGLAYLASSLVRSGHSAEILDLNVLPRFDAIGFVAANRPDVIGVTSTTVSFTSARSLLGRIKERLPDVPTVLGGPHISAIPAQTMEECPAADIGVVGEGEAALVELAAALRDGSDMSRVRGLVYRKGGHLVQTAPRPPLEALDALPFPARGLIRNFKGYHQSFLRQSRPSVSMITSRGCPCRCAFCTQAVFGAHPRGHSAEYVCEEIARVKKDHHVNFVSFEDDTFNFSRPRLRAICEKMLSSGLNVVWGCSVRMDFLNEEDVALMARAGCRKIYVGIESLNPRIQKLVRKEMSIAAMKEKLGMIRRLGMDVNASFMIGFPTETEAEIRQTVDGAGDLPLEGAFFCIYTPYPATPLRDLALAHGRVSQDWDDYSNHLSTHAYYPDTIDVAVLGRLFYRAYRKFYFSPRRLSRNLLNPELAKQVFGYVLGRRN